MFSYQTLPMKYWESELLLGWKTLKRFSENDIMHAIDDMKVNAASGPDGFPSIYLNQCKSSLSFPLFMFWDTCFQQGNIPCCLKRGAIVPIFKSGKWATPTNYRPVALTSHIMKIFERVIKNAVVSYMDQHNLIKESQRICSGRSCISQLLDHMYSIQFNQFISLYNT